MSDIIAVHSMTKDYGKGRGIFNFDFSVKQGEIFGLVGTNGSGKTTIALNTALRLAQNNKKVSIVDLDIVNPYFRTSDFPELLKKNSIEMIAPMYAGSNLDIPAVNFDMERIISESSHVVIDLSLIHI